MKHSTLRIIPLMSSLGLTLLIWLSMNSYRYCEFVGDPNYSCLQQYLPRLGFTALTFGIFAVATGLFLLFIRPAFTRRWLLPAFLFSIFSLFMILTVAEQRPDRFIYSNWFGLAFYFGTIAIMLAATWRVRMREGRPPVTVDGIAKLLLLLPLTYFVFHITVFAFGNYFSNTLM